MREPEVGLGDQWSEEAQPAGYRSRHGRAVPLGCEPGSGYEVTDTDRRWLEQAVALSRRCSPSSTAFSVGAIVVSNEGQVLATGYSREWGGRDHAEEVALAKLEPDQALGAATLYSSLEPCRHRASRPRPCAELIISMAVHRVVLAWREPPVFTDGGGADLLRDAGVIVVEVPELAQAAQEVNLELLSP